MKNVLITGATGDIGIAIVKAFAQKGYNVALHTNSKPDIAKDFADTLCKTYDVKATYVQADVSKNNEVEAMFSKIENELGKIDILVNNAGVSLVKMLCDTSEEDFDRVMDINLKGAFLTSKEAMKNMVHNKWGRIINVASVAGVYGNANMAHYSATKGAVIAFTKALAKEVTDKGVLVNCVSPGSVSPSDNHDIDYTAESALSFMGRTGSDRENANLICFLASDEASYIAGQNIQIDGCRKKQ
jgi:3-oxoacyl-[acyl-carrier protein] reductase